MQHIYEEVHVVALRDFDEGIITGGNRSGGVRPLAQSLRAGRERMRSSRYGGHGEPVQVRQCRQRSGLDATHVKKGSPLTAANPSLISTSTGHSGITKRDDDTMVEMTESSFENLHRGGTILRCRRPSKCRRRLVAAEAIAGGIMGTPRTVEGGINHCHRSLFVHRIVA